MTDPKRLSKEREEWIRCRLGRDKGTLIEYQLLDEVDALRSDLLNSREQLLTAQRERDEIREHFLAEMDKTISLRKALEEIVLYTSYNGDTWPADIARKALGKKE